MEVHCLCDSSDPSVNSHAVRAPGFVDKFLVASRKVTGATMQRADRNIGWRRYCIKNKGDNQKLMEISVVKAG